MRHAPHAIGIVAGVVAGVVVLVAIYLFWPFGTVHAWQPSVAIGTPVKSLHMRALDAVQRLAVGVDRGPVALTVEPAGNIYAGSVVAAYRDGPVIRLSADGAHYQRLGSTHGAPLGIAASAGEALLIADARRGLLALNDHGNVLTLDDARGVDGVSVAPRGTTIYFTRLSSHHRLRQIATARFAHDLSGSLHAYDAVHHASRQLADGLALARSVALGPGNAYALVTQAGAYQILRVWLAGPKKGQTEVFARGLPGFAAGISFNGTNRFWVAIPTQRSAPLDSLAPRSIYRRLMLRLPPWFMPATTAKPSDDVIAFDLDGQR
ncbi:MAG TPA: hypothetical protein VFQ88_00465, partial [Nevskiaceae bacterium]|nr:hypothetical protein [Nevskiaceae bacterium]